MALNGGCLCGEVRYEIAGELRNPIICHCSMCRRQSGTAFLAWAETPTNRFRWVKGEELLSRYESSPGGIRIFCSKCGSTLGGGAADPKAEAFFVSLGTLDQDPGVRPEAHIFVGSKAPWYEINDTLPQFEEYPPAR